MKTYTEFINEEMMTLNDVGGMGEIQMPDSDNGVIGSGDIPDNMVVGDTVNKEHESLSKILAKLKSGNNKKNI